MASSPNHDLGRARALWLPGRCSAIVIQVPLHVRDLYFLISAEIDLITVG
jgi:hypothetical protein